MEFSEKFSEFKNLFNTYLDKHLINIDIFRGDEEGYRLRAEFGAWHENEPSYNLKHFVYDSNTKQKVFCEQFTIACPLINKLMPLVSNFFNGKPEQAFKLFQIEYLTSLQKQAIITLIYHRKLDESCLDIAKKLQSFIIEHSDIEEKDLNIIFRSRKRKFVLGNDFINETLTVNNKKIHYQIAETCFSQPNGAINQLMLSYVQNNLHIEKDILELYCGSGNFTLILATCGREVLATEVNKTAVNFVKRNLELNNIDNVQVGRISAEEFVQAMNKVRPFKRLNHVDLESYDFDAVLIDPPRCGLDNESLDMISAYKQIVYVSCNPNTLMPNLKYLIDRYNYKLVKIGVFDQFPKTPHLETIAFLIKD